MMEKNLQDEVRILHDEVKKRDASRCCRPRRVARRPVRRVRAARRASSRKGTELTPEVLQGLNFEHIVRSSSAATIRRCRTNCAT